MDNLQRKYEHADHDEPDTPNLDNPPLVEDQKGAGEAGTSGGSPKSKKRKRGEGSSEDEDLGVGGDPLVPGESPNPGGFTSSSSLMTLTSDMIVYLYSRKRKKEGVIP